MDTTFNPVTIPFLHDFVQNRGNNILYIYGEKDTWTATGVNPFIYTNMTDYFRRQYQVEESFMDIIRFFAVLAIIIAVLGQLSLTSQDMIQKTKGIAIKQVIGANSLKILGNYLVKSC